MKIAIDVFISKAIQKQLEGLGYEVVVRANDGETDESWITRANNAGVQFVISNDFDIPKLIEIRGYEMVWVTTSNFGLSENTIPKNYISTYIHLEIQRKLQFYKRLAS